MYYALRQTAHADMLIEIGSRKEENELSAAGYRIRRVTAQEAHRWVKNDFPHETGLYVENNRIRYAGVEK